MTVIMKNKIPQILNKRELNISDFHSLLIRGGKDTNLSYPKAHELATVAILPDTMSLGTVRKAAVALGVSLGDVIELEIV